VDENVLKRLASVRDALTAPNFDVRGWVDDLFTSFEDENGEIHLRVDPPIVLQISDERIEMNLISAGTITTDRIYVS
jgi:hypothetical protein